MQYRIHCPTRPNISQSKILKVPQSENSMKFRNVNRRDLKPENYSNYEILGRVGLFQLSEDNVLSEKKIRERRNVPIFLSSQGFCQKTWHALSTKIRWTPCLIHWACVTKLKTVTVCFLTLTHEYLKYFLPTQPWKLFSIFSHHFFPTIPLCPAPPKPNEYRLHA